MSKSNNADAGSGSPIPILAPCALLQVWLDESIPARRETLTRIDSQFVGREGARAVGEGLFAVVAVPGDPATFDAALAWGREILAGLRPADSSTASTNRVLIYPGVVKLGASATEVIGDSLFEDLEQQPPVVPASGVYLTGRAVKVLEQSVEIVAKANYQGPSGKFLPIVMAGDPTFEALPWRNPRPLDRKIKTVARPELDDAADAVLREAVARIVGPLGCGKTRLVWEALSTRGEPRLWLTARPRRAPQPTLRRQLMAQLVSETRGGEDAAANLVGQRLEQAADRAHLILEGLCTRSHTPINLVCDEAHLVAGDDLELLRQILASPHLGETLRVILIGRGGADWPHLNVGTALEVPPMQPSEAASLGEQLATGLSLPEQIQERFLAAAAGNPFALEEGLFALLHERSLRQIYGSFFFGGSQTAGYQPSPRFIRHLEAEAARFGPTTPARLLALAAQPVPASELTAAAGILGERADSGWDAKLAAAGIVRYVESPWGQAAKFASPAFGRALERGLPESVALQARHDLGELLAARSQNGEASWRAYQLLAGSADAVEPLLAALSSAYGPEIDNQQSLAALTDELHKLRQRGESSHTELKLLWRLLPLARRMGKLHKYIEDLERGVELAAEEPKRLLALASIKAEMDLEAGNFADAEATIKRALTAASDTDQRRQALLMIQLGRLFLRQSRYEEARHLFSNLRQALDSDGPASLSATCRFFLGNIDVQEGRLAEAFDHHTAALETRKQEKLMRPVGSSLSALGTVSLAIGNYPQAISYYEQAKEILEEHGKEGEESFALIGVGRARTRLGDYASASQPLRRALALRQGRDDNAGEAIARLAVAENYQDLGQSDTALSEARQAHFQLSLLSAEAALADAEQLLGRIRCAQRKYVEAARHLQTALTKHRQHGEERDVAFDLSWLIETALALEDIDAVRRNATGLRESLTNLQRTEMGEVLFFRLYRGLSWLSAGGHKVGDPLTYLRQAYEQVLANAGHLEPALRSGLLFQVPENQAIVEAATREGLTHGPAAGG